MEAIKTRMDETEEQISDTKGKIMENDEAEENRKTKIRDHNGILTELSDLLIHNNIQIIGGSEEKERKRGRRFL